ncbi:MAG TPA: zinc ribbon domain-containing protein [Bryobacteraceae bacterium]|nr:zinc ribbon domain-containing protein [Bryobacteraceae bacterium]
MFSWICPKCGKEVPPAYSECPNCATPEAEALPPAKAPPAARVDEPAPARNEAPPPAQDRASETSWHNAESPRRAAGSRNWIYGLVIGAAIVVIGLTAVVLLRSDRVRESAPPSTAALENPPLAPGAQANPILQQVELTGFRILEDPKQKPELRFIVVNHSGADLGEVKAKANLHAATNEAGVEPVATFTFAVKLGPYESKELKVALATKLRAYELPDWQRLKADITP